MPQRPTPRGQRFLVALSLVLLGVGFLLVWPVRTPVAFALIAAYLAYPVYRWLQKRVRWRPVAAILVMLLVAVLLVAPLVGLAFPLVQQAQSVASQVQREGLREPAAEALISLGMPESRVNETIVAGQQRIGTFLEESIIPVLRFLLDLLVGLVIFFILLYFLLVDGAAIAQRVRDLMPLDEVRSRRLLNRVGERVRSVIVGTLLVSVLQGVLAGIGWWILGFPDPIFWGAVMTVLSVVPAVGAFVVLLPAAAYAFATGNVVGGIGLLVLNFVLVGLVDDVVRPFVIGRSSGVHPAVILIGILGGFAVFGIAGFVLGPVFLSLVAPVIEAAKDPHGVSLQRAPKRPPGALRRWWTRVHS